jgi:hypothetical protein
MNFIINNTKPRAYSAELYQVMDWMPAHFDDEIFTIQPNYMLDLNPEWIKYFAYAGWKLREEFKIVYLIGKLDRYNFSVFNIISRKFVDGIFSDYRADLVVWLKDENLAIQCKLAMG